MQPTDRGNPSASPWQVLVSASGETLGRDPRTGEVIDIHAGAVPDDPDDDGGETWERMLWQEATDAQGKPAYRHPETGTLYYP